MSKIAWHKTDNALWVRGVTTQMDITVWERAPRNVNRNQLSEQLAWCETADIKVDYLGDGLIAFETAEDKLMFLLRWTGQ